MLIAALGSGHPVFGQDGRLPGGAWRTSPHHGQINGATGQPIPCLCRYRGRDYRVGEAVCMTTHMGTLITVCDLKLNNTTWVPTGEPCTTSRPARPAYQSLIDAG